jgi:hypothetical protein
LSISENQLPSAALGSIEAEQNESVKRVPAAAKWGMAGLLVVYAGVSAYAVATLGSSVGSRHPEGVTRSVATALGQSAAPSGPTSAPGTESLWGQLANAKAASSAATSAQPTAPTQPATPPDAVLTAISATAVGPDGSSDGDHPQLAALVLDPDSQTSWVTHWYQSAYFGHLQDGTGLLLDMGRSVTIRQIELALAGTPGSWGADLQIRVGDSPDLASAAPVVSATDVGGWVTAELQAPATGRYVQIWFTKLPLDREGTYQEHVYHVTVHGSAPRPPSSSASPVNIHHGHGGPGGSGGRGGWRGRGGGFSHR